MSFPSPPVLKTTIIQLNKELDTDSHNNNYEILTNNYNNSNNSNINSSSNNSSNKSPIGASDESMPTSPNLEALAPNKKKRRRSTANVDSEELAKRKHETKQLHSIIEKRRRVKINREFEALKYLIPACRNCNSGSSSPNQDTNSSPKKSQNTGGSGNNGNKIDGMYKLTILKSSVEYILYLHHIIQKQQELIVTDSSSNSESAKGFDIDFAKVPLDVNQYRNIDVEFNFKTLLNEVENVEKEQESLHQAEATSNEPRSSRSSWTPNHNGIIEEEEEEEREREERPGNSRQSSDGDINCSTSSRASSVAPSLPSIPSQMSISSMHKASLPTPDFTPDMAPIFTMLNKYSDNNMDRRYRKVSYPISPQTFAVRSANPSPFTNPLKSTLSNATSPSLRNYINRSNTNACANANANSNANAFALPDPAITPSSSMPRDKSKGSVGIGKSVTQDISSREKKDEDMEEEEEQEEIQLSDQCASKTLLALRKSSIGNLLN
ncbi:hypothetical protein CANMA_002561 [Candida margitis]|uniref:uncharacterized protein n=1 Tax=Candida margitis TaxID=1775924 RepID=UPI0022275A0F|nr:uncharacterized protein CANMA_002561 [Candida margitis]KAI5968138.1 hypothetical protein CANMA_002561 [Candida margitis]